MKCKNGHYFEMSFGHFKSGHRCRFCYNENQKLTYEFVKEFVEKKGCKLLSETYENVNSKLKLKCSSGHIFELNFKQFKQGHRCYIDDLGYRKK